MASLRLTFPEKEQPSVIALTGARLTIGRLPFNTIQIIDRTVSGFHAELISEHGHYRLHDRGSSNGTFVNGERISDFHLSEACTITFGTVEAQFSPEAAVANEEVEDFPTRTEINSVRQENAELRARVAAVREEADALRLARPLQDGDLTLAVTKDEYDKVVIERERLKEERLKQEEEIARLKTDLAVLKRDRVNLQLAYDGVQRELTDLRAKASGVEEIALLPGAAASALAAQVPAPGEEVRVQVPAAPASPKPPAAKTAPIHLPAAAPETKSTSPDSEIAPTAPAPSAEPSTSEPDAQPKPFVATPPTPSLPKAPGVAAKPFSPVPKGPVAVPAAASLPKTPTAVPAAASLPKMSAAVPPATSLPKTPTAVPAAASLPKTPTVGANPVARPTVAATPVARPMAAAAGGMKPRAGLGSGLRPMARPAVPPSAAGRPSEGEDTATNAESAPPAAAPNGLTPRLIPRPTPTAKLPLQPTIKLPAVPPPASGPKGTQKL